MEKYPIQNQNNSLPPLTQQEFNAWQPPEGEPVTHTTIKVKSLDQMFTIQRELPNPLENSTDVVPSAVYKSPDSSTATSAHEEQPMKIPETNVEEGPVEPLALTSALVFGGIKHSITALRLKRAEDKLGRIETNDHVIKHAPREADALRGFNTYPGLKSKDRPISLSERAAFWHRGNQVAKNRKQAREKSRLREVYGEPAPPPSKPRIRRSSTGTAAADRWNVAAGKLEKIDGGVVASFDSRGRERTGEKLTRQRAERRHHSADERTDTINRKLETGTGKHGGTVPADIRQRRINKQKRKIEKLEKKLSK